MDWTVELVCESCKRTVFSMPGASEREAQSGIGTVGNQAFNHVQAAHEGESFELTVKISGAKGKA